ncbi:hypothetical protein [Alkalihalobacillus sp. BA299]|uniref:hypothetical protein n=1 Tax=Alkalihalobacillus sp. BA299 TaxID=2815938 RepID=UPI001ADBF922|nr:hypothetical protein [Alkalihalobacillus sp. BA299]
MQKPTIKDILTLNERFYHQDMSSDNHFLFLPGNGHTLISAPHSVPQLREGKEKRAEYLTGVLTHFLHERTGCYGAYKTKNNQDDANYDKVNPYKDMLVEKVKHHHIQYVLDLHIMSDQRPHSIDIGTGRGRNIQQQLELSERIQAIFLNHQFENVLIDHIFTAGFAHTVSSTVSRECGIIAFQLEINWRFLQSETDATDFNRILDALTEIVHYLNERGAA